MKQKDLIVKLVKDILGDTFVPKETVVKDVITKEQRKLLKNSIIDAIQDGTVNYSKDRTDINAVKKYAANVINNYFRKSLELNGNSPYKPPAKEDKSIKEMKKLLQVGGYEPGSVEFEHITEAIESRQAEIDLEKANSAKAPSNNESVLETLPEDLSSLL